MTETHHTEDTDMNDVLVIRNGHLTPEITEPTVVGVVVRFPTMAYELAEAITVAGKAIPFPEGSTTECLSVLVEPAGELGSDGIDADVYEDE